MKRQAQQDFFQNDREHAPNRSTHGGDLNTGKRRIDRPFRKNEAQHIVMKSTIATGAMSLLNPHFETKIEDIVEKYAARFQIEVQAFQNVGNHLHFMVVAPRKKFLQSFLKTVSGMIARLVTGAKKGKPFGRKFWDHLTFSRLVHGYRDSQSMLNYINKNSLEAELGPRAREVAEKFEQEIRGLRNFVKSLSMNPI